MKTRTATQAERFFDKTVNGSLAGISGRDITPDRIVPRRNTILARVIPPEKTVGKLGLIELPDVAVHQAAIAVIVATPQQDDCPYENGQVIIYRTGAGEFLGIVGLEDYMLFNFAVNATDIDPDILAIIKPKESA